MIGAIVVLNAAFGFTQELRGRACRARPARVARERRLGDPGRQRASRSPPASSSPGDLVRIREGDRVPADARVLHTHGLEVDESAADRRVGDGREGIARRRGRGTARGADVDGLRRHRRHARERDGRGRRDRRAHRAGRDRPARRTRPRRLRRRCRRGSAGWRAGWSCSASASPSSLGAAMLARGESLARRVPRRRLGRGRRGAGGACRDGHDRARARLS